MLLKSLISILDSELSSSAIVDYCPNGLQIEGKPEVSNIVTGVTASLALIEAAIAMKADAILVHHGYFWKGENQTICGMKKERIRQLLMHDISLIAYHLPLDVHACFGNNAQLAKMLNIQNIQPISSIQPNGIVMAGQLPESMDHVSFSSYLSNSLNRQIVSVGNKAQIKNVAWCTGGGQHFIDQVTLAQVNGHAIDAYISGEISEQTTHSAREQDIDYFAAGHHATERYGIKALGQWLQQQHSLNVEFVDIDNPA